MDRKKKTIPNKLKSNIRRYGANILKSDNNVFLLFRAISELQQQENLKVERRFSQYRYLFSKRRCSLTFEHLKQMFIVYCKQHGVTNLIYNNYI